MRLLNHIQSERGESLIGLMVGITVGLIVLSGAIAFYVNTVSSNRQIMEARLLNQDLKATMAMMVREVRRAQFINNAEQHRFKNPCNDPFCNDASDFSFPTAHPTLANGYRIIEFSYDKNPDSLQDNDECFGFRLATGSSVVEMKTDCTPTWLQLTDPDTIQVTDLSFLVHCEPSSGSALYSRLVDISLTGRLTADATRTLTLNESVKVRSDILLSDLPKNLPSSLSYCVP
ncbi:MULTISPECIES: PilW family protein [unclassified Thiocapsa]|uniref:PilW family protein n=1 Tax=unclassified Thiocapsa TaxID=2641286 RepID=UPI0035B1D729